MPITYLQKLTSSHSECVLDHYPSFDSRTLSFKTILPSEPHISNRSGSWTTSLVLHLESVIILVNLTLSANHPVHPCVPAKGNAHAYTQNCARIHRESPEDAHARAQQRTHLYNYFLTCLKMTQNHNSQVNS